VLEIGVKLEDDIRFVFVYRYNKAFFIGMTEPTLAFVIQDVNIWIFFDKLIDLDPRAIGTIVVDKENMYVVSCAKPENLGESGSNWSDVAGFVVSRDDNDYFRSHNG